jgi:hypothetical protein
MSTFFKTAAGVVLAVGIASASTVYAADNEANPSQGSGMGPGMMGNGKMMPQDGMMGMMGQMSQMMDRCNQMMESRTQPPNSRFPKPGEPRQDG